MSVLNLSYGICHTPVAPLKAEPAHRSEMVSQLLFGEIFAIKEIDDTQRWLLVENFWDGYMGWLNAGQVTLLSHKDIKKSNKYISYSHKGVFMIPDVKEPAMHVPLGADLFNLRSGKVPWCETIGRFRGIKSKLGKNTWPSGTDIIRHAMMYLGAPYLWGGKSFMGIDCSGLSQMAYKLSDIRLPRDASQQVDHGAAVDFIEQTLPGDLAFFDNEEGRIYHVGIMLSGDTIIHATESSGGVVIDQIDNGGIISQKHKKRTHNLRIIKRIITG